MNQLHTQAWVNEDNLFDCYTLLSYLAFPSMRIILGAVLEATSNYLYDSAQSEKTFIPYWLKKVRNDE